MKYLKIPMDRVGVIIGHNGETKKNLEGKSGVKLEIDSKSGEIAIDDHNVKDPLYVLKVENIVKAMGRGFSPEKAMILMNDDADFFVFDLRDYVGKKDSHLRRLKSRIIGSEGKTKRVLEELTGSKISVYGHTVSIISDVLRMNILKKSIDMLLTGSKHATVYRFVESQIKELKRSEKYGF
ncbi:MAG: RNA-processing protein [Thermoplasmatales archaeon]|nr:MAG: RNA-processing protein [Thermoplasmatales archaeon]